MLDLVSLVGVVVSIVLLLTISQKLVAGVVYMKDWRGKSKCVQQWPGPETNWLTGSLKYPPGEDCVSWRLQQTAKYTQGYSFWYGPFLPTIVANNAKLVKFALKNCDRKPHEGGSYGLLIPWLGLGLLVSNGPRWFRSRKLLTPAFHFEILKPYVTVYNKCVDVFLSKLEKYSKSGESIEVHSQVSLLTLDILLRCAFTWKDNNCQVQGDSHPYVMAVRDLADITQRRLQSPAMMFDTIFYRTSTGRKYKKACEFVHKTSEDIIKRRKLELESQQESEPTKRKYPDFLDILLMARDSDGEGLGDSEIRAECDTFLFEGHDTTASGISWTLYLLAKYPEHQRKCQAEVDSLLHGRGDDVINWDDLPKLTYLTQCIKESLRMRPPVPGVHREVDKELHFDGKVIKPGTRMEINVTGLHHNPDYWPEPFEFKPDRFSPENTAKMDPFAYLPFVAGQRNCIGQNFALNEEKVVLARILHKYDLEVDPDHGVERIALLVLKATHGIKLKIRPR
ncbi:cytochrome P450 4A24-like [Ptychodera flava]|uniref:cytochrome P450 4A24-like n=1 Tax=Ptychodera flava TaxID=63121 RepID=UPI003969C33A